MDVDKLRDRHAANLARVDTFIAAYQRDVSGRKGRATVAQADLLRASVVFAHASLESLARTLLSFRLASADPGVLEKLLSFPNDKDKDRGKRVEKVS